MNMSTVYKNIKLMIEGELIRSNRTLLVGKRYPSNEYTLTAQGDAELENLRGLVLELKTL